MLKVSKKSKDWVADPANRECDAPGSWYCNGQYPPALADLIGRRKNFAQLEDFNRKRTSEDEAYNKQYMARMAGEAPPPDMDEADFNMPDDDDEPAKKTLSRAEKKAAKKAKKKAEPAKEIDFGDDDTDIIEEDDGIGLDLEAANDDSAAPAPPDGPAPWKDTPVTTRLWGLINANDYEQLAEWIEADPNLVHSRAGDGRGPLWWAEENGRTDIIELLKSYDIDVDAEDDKGMKAADMRKDEL